MRKFIILTITLLICLPKTGFAQPSCRQSLAGGILSATTLSFWSTLSKEEQASFLKRLHDFSDRVSLKNSSLNEVQSRFRELIEFSLTGSVLADDGAAWIAKALRELSEVTQTAPESKAALLALANVFSAEPSPEEPL